MNKFVFLFLFFATRALFAQSSPWDQPEYWEKKFPPTIPLNETELTSNPEPAVQDTVKFDAFRWRDAEICILIEQEKNDLVEKIKKQKKPAERRETQDW